MPIAVVASLLLAQSSASQPMNPFVNPMFSDNMVLQRDKPDPIWGWTSPGAKVTVSIDGKTSAAVADTSGRWITKLPKFSAGGSYTLTVSGPSSASFSNVTFGDVWICSGQSNMEFGIGNLKNGGTDEIAAANYPNIRLCRIPKLIAGSPVPYAKATWAVCTPESIAQDGDWNGFSAVGYFFGRKLNQDLNVPIGLVHTSWGGTIAEAWTSEDWLRKKLPEFDKPIDNVKLSASAGSNYDQLLTDWYKKNDPGIQATPAWSDPSFSDDGWKTMQVPGYVQKTGIPELNNQASIFWLRKTIDLPTDSDLDNAVLHFGADDNDTTWVNGTMVGSTVGVNIPRAYKMPAGLLHSGKNLVVVRVTDTSQPGGIFTEPFIEIPSRPQISLAGDWKVKLGAAITDQNSLPMSFGDNPNLPTVLYNGMVYPLAPFGVKGAIWYQGESNVGRAVQYQTLLPSMIDSWRDIFQDGNFPFFIVQLAGFMHPPVQPGDDGWAELREAQMIASVKTSNAGIATAIDIGEQDDIHPKNKQEVGRRLALVAEAKVYGKSLEYSGPRYHGFSIQGSSIRISLDHSAGLKTGDGRAPKGFAIAGDDHQWHWADAKIDGNAIIVSSADVQHPVAVRYGWASFLDLNLQNGEGLPAFPFRTDSWKIN